MIPVYRPYLKKYKGSAIEAIESEWVSNHGIYINLATDALKNILGAKHCILMNNGTSATQCLFKALKFKYPEITKIYVPNNVFVAPWNCALMEYEKDNLEVMKMDEGTLNIDVSEEYIASLDAGSAVIIVHNLGNIVNVPRLKRMRPDIIFIEDNCEGLFGKYEGVFSGTADSSLCSSASFYGNKTITSGEGGAFFTNDDEVFRYMNSLYSHGMTSARYVHDILATNFRMTNIQAGLLYEQLKDIEHILSIKRDIYARYVSLLEGSVQMIQTEQNTEHSTWMFSFVLPGLDYADFEKYMTNVGIDVRPLFYDISVHTHLEGIINDNSSLEIAGAMLPSFPELTEEQQIYICNNVKAYVCNM